MLQSIQHAVFYLSVYCHDLVIKNCVMFKHHLSWTVWRINSRFRYSPDENYLGSGWVHASV